MHCLLIGSAANVMLSGSASVAGTQPATSSGATGRTTGFYLPPQDRIPNHAQRQSLSSCKY